MQQDNSQRELPTRDYTGVVNIGGKDLNCAVLSDGTRVLTASSVFKAFGRPRRGKSSGDQRAANMPSFIDANNLKPLLMRFLGADQNSIWRYSLRLKMAPEYTPCKKCAQ